MDTGTFFIFILFFFISIALILSIAGNVNTTYMGGNWDSNLFTEHKRDKRKKALEEIDRLVKEAQQREEALDYDNAIRIWEKLGEIKEAARVRRLKSKQGAVKVTQKVVHGDQVTKTEIKDSVVSKSNIGSGGDDKLNKIKELKELHDAGAIDDDEFKQMKKEILSK